MKQATTPAAPDTASLADRATLRDHPIGFWFFFWGEFAERCCYYGMRAILLLYMIQILNFEDGQASRVISYFMAACYFLPLVGGYVADHYLGKYRTIVYFSIPYIIGQAMLGITALHNETCLLLSLGLLAMGTGVIKPNISTLMGLTYDQKRPGRARLRSDAFAMFYGAINIGAAISSFAVPAIRNYYGGDSHAYAVAFLFPAVLMILAFIVFAAGKPFYAEEAIKRVQPTPEERRQRWIVLRRLFGLFFVVAVFWSIYDQSVSTWILFARDHMHLELFGLPLSPDMIQAINPLLIVVLLPPMTMLWHFLANVGLNLKPTSKMLIGFLLTFITMVITAWAGFRAESLAVAGAPAALTAAEDTAKAAVAGCDRSALAAAHATVAAEVAQRSAKMAKIAGLAGEPREVDDVANVGRQAADDTESAGKAVVSATADLSKHVIEVAQSARNAAESLAVAKAKAEVAEAAAEAAKKAAKEAAAAAGHHQTALATAALASAAAVRAARAAQSAAQLEGPSRPKSVAEAFTAAVAADLAAKATTAAVREAQKEPNEESTRSGRKLLAECSEAANRASAAATSARRAAQAAKDENVEAAPLHAAVAVLTATDAAAIVTRAAAKWRDNEVPDVVDRAEQSAAQARISVWWQLIPYVIITAAEICISVVGLELAFAAAPAAMKSFVTACWLLAVFFGDLLNAQITPLYNETVLGFTLAPGPYFAAFAVLMIPVTLAFLLIAQQFNRAASNAAQAH
jgi:POT family proton-dependent oligopeptide transporter